MDKLHVALLSANRLPVEKYGGTQRQLVGLARELLRLGHRVTLVAPSGSFIPGARMIFAATAREAFARIPRDVDIVNSHCGDPPAGFDRPCLITHHGNSEAPVGGNRNFVSRDHARRHGRETFVHNGLAVDEALFGERKSERYLFLSRINRSGKNVTRALRLAIEHDLQLDLAGGGRWVLLTRSAVRRERAFLTSLDRRFAFHGEVGGWTKARLLAEARALLFPIRWNEPFGLVVIEALLAGTPVIASPRGPMPELINPDIGFLCETDAEFADAFATVGAIPARYCRDYAAEHFSIEKTTAKYLGLYQRILEGEALP